MDTKAKEIIVNKMERKELKEVFQCSDAALSQALNGRTNSKLSRLIRTYAANKLNGVVI